MAKKYKIKNTNILHNGNLYKIGDVIDVNLVSANLKKARKSKALTQKAVADALQTTQSNIHKYETGKCLITTVYALEFAKHFSCSLDDLLGRK